MSELTINKLRQRLSRSVFLRTCYHSLRNTFGRYSTNPLKANIEETVNKYPFLRFDPKHNDLNFINDELGSSDLLEFRRQLIMDFKQVSPRRRVKISEIFLDYYDKCLLKYLENVHKRGMPLSETCWHKYAQRNKAIWSIENQENPQIAIEKFMSKMQSLGKTGYSREQLLAENGVLFFKNNGIENSGNSEVVPERVLALYESISMRGWQDALSEQSPIIIGFSEMSKKYHMMAGRHRVACLQYLQSQGLLPLNFSIKCHLFRYPYEKLVPTRPYFQICKGCDWNQKMTIGEPNTHQQFLVDKGMVKPLSKESQDKWGLIQPVFSELVKGKFVLDLGAYRGLYSLKALEFGAKSVTAVDIGQHFVESINNVSMHMGEERLQAFQGDFHLEETYTKLKCLQHDVMIVFGLIHHLLRLGIQKEILKTYDELIKRISNLVTTGVLIEFAEPRESSLILPEILPFQEAFKRERFVEALKNQFKSVNLLGKCKYRSNRFMYYALK